MCCGRYRIRTRTCLACDITEFSLWTRLKVVGGGSLKEDFKDSDDEEEIDDDLGDLLDDDSDLPDLEEDADLDELL